MYCVNWQNLLLGMLAKGVRMAGNNTRSVSYTTLLATLITMATISYWLVAGPDWKNRVAGQMSSVQPSQATEGFLPNPVPIPEFPKGVDWINTSSRLSLNDLRGKLVLLDFWTYCCINCMHLLPVLEQAEEKYARELVVIGVHTPKFDAEKETKNVRDAILRYDIKHPVLNDSQEILWRQLGVATWPTLVLVDPDGRAIWAHAGEIAFADLDRVLARAQERYSAQGRIDSRRVHFDLAIQNLEETPLRFPGKVAIDGSGGRLAIADSNHHRIVITDVNGRLLSVIGTGVAGRNDGGFAQASFNHPQGVAFHGEQLFVADTENHLIRRIDLATQAVVTVAGTGNQTRNPWQNFDHSQPLSTQDLTRSPLRTDLGSPWDVLVSGNQLYIAMAGPHQIWSMSLDGKTISIYAGSGREDINDGPLLPRSQFSARSSTFAQPSGLSTDGQQLYVADSEGSSIRAVPLDPAGMVSTVVGTAQLFDRRLFTFGMRDGPFEQALMQHPLGVAYQSRKLFVADTYNNAIRVIDLTAGHVQTLVGSDQPASDQVILNQPGGLCVHADKLFIADTNNHRVAVFDLKLKALTTLSIPGLTPPQPASKAKDSLNRIPNLPKGANRRVAPELVLGSEQAELTMKVEFSLPKGWKLNPLAPLRFVAIWNSATNANALAESTFGQCDAENSTNAVTLNVPKENQLKLVIGLTYYFCRADGKGLCLADSAVIEIPVRRDKGTKPGTLLLQQAVQVRSR